MIRAVELVTEGEFQTGTTDAGWRPFTASQRFSTRPPGFVWDARIQMAPFSTVYVRDAYVGGHTEMRGRALGLIPVVDEADTPGLAADSSTATSPRRFWFPTALLPDHNAVSWHPIDTKSAVVKLTDRGVTVSVRSDLHPRGRRQRSVRPRADALRERPVRADAVGRAL